MSDDEQLELDELPCGHHRDYLEAGECMICESHLDGQGDRDAREGVLR